MPEQVKRVSWENPKACGLLAEVFPGVTLTREVGEFGTLLAIDPGRAGLRPAALLARARDPGSS